MLKLFAWLCIIVGVLLTLTIFLAGFGIPLISFGVIVLVAIALVDRHARKSAEREHLRRYDSVDDSRSDGVSNSMFGR